MKIAQQIAYILQNVNHQPLRYMSGYVKRSVKRKKTEERKEGQPIQNEKELGHKNLDTLTRQLAHSLISAELCEETDSLESESTWTFPPSSSYRHTGIEYNLLLGAVDQSRRPKLNAQMPNLSGNSSNVFPLNSVHSAQFGNVV